MSINTKKTYKLLEYLKQKHQQKKKEDSDDKTVNILDILKSRKRAKATDLLLKPCDSCLFCESMKQRKKTFAMISTALYVKHTPNLNYHYTKNINDILASKRTAKVILYKDLIFFNESKEYCRRMYDFKELPEKLVSLTEFYQYHVEIPNLHMVTLEKILRNYQIKKRKIEYIQVRKILGYSVHNDIMESSYEPNSSKISKKTDCNPTDDFNFKKSNILKDLYSALQDKNNSSPSISLTECSKLEKENKFANVCDLLSNLNEVSILEKEENLNLNKKVIEEEIFRKTPKNQNFFKNVSPNATARSSNNQSYKQIGTIENLKKINTQHNQLKRQNSPLLLNLNSPTINHAMIKKNSTMKLLKHKRMSSNNFNSSNPSKDFIYRNVANLTTTRNLVNPLSTDRTFEFKSKNSKLAVITEPNIIFGLSTNKIKSKDLKDFGKFDTDREKIKNFKDFKEYERFETERERKFASVGQFKKKALMIRNDNDSKGHQKSASISKLSSERNSKNSHGRYFSLTTKQNENELNLKMNKINLNNNFLKNRLDDFLKIKNMRDESIIQ